MDSPSIFEDFLIFERKVFGDELPIPRYDPYLIRYGEYRYPLEMVTFQSGERLLDVGCEHNIFILFLASLGLDAWGVDLNPRVWGELQQKKKRVERILGRKLAVRFKAEDATRLSFEPESFDKAVAISSIEHMFSDQGHGDQLAVAGIARILKPGGMAIITLPMSNGAPFHESRQGDSRFAGPYRLYTPEALAERILSNPDLETVNVSYLFQTTPDPYYTGLYFFRFWSEKLTPQERQKWAWANPILGNIFNPITPRAEAEAELERVNTALVCLRKKA